MSIKYALLLAAATAVAPALANGVVYIDGSVAGESCTLRSSDASQLVTLGDYTVAYAKTYNNHTALGASRPIEIHLSNCSPSTTSVSTTVTFTDVGKDWEIANDLSSGAATGLAAAIGAAPEHPGSNLAHMVNSGSTIGKTSVVNNAAVITLYATAARFGDAASVAAGSYHGTVQAQLNYD